MVENNKNILIIGMSQMGKTNFGGQLYGRLKSLDNAFRLRKTPDDLSLFEEILDRLNDGFEGAHTSTQLHETVTLPIESKDGNNSIDLVYPDYGGEQIRGIVEQREVPVIWQQQIQNSNHWFLFIDLNLMENISDVTTKFYQQIEGETDENGKVQNLIDLPETSAAFYIELLQIFLFTKGVNLSSAIKPKLTILLSLWDKYKPMYEDNILPASALLEKMPLLSTFIANNWQENQYQIVGLSSLGKDLFKDKADKEYRREGPEKFGYLIFPNGKKEDDITQILNNVLS